MSRDAELLGVAADARHEGRVDEAKNIARQAIRLPHECEGLPVIASVSGGKDSTALILALREAQIPARYAFADTGWEADETYDYLAMLEERLQITIVRVRAEPKSSSLPDLIAGAYGEIAEFDPPRDERGRWSAMVDRIRVRAGFPGRMQRFCTRELKIEPLRVYHDRVEEETGLETVSAMGVRAQESDRRAKMKEFEDEGPKFTRERWGGYVWRPLLQWTVEDVLLIHRRHGIPVNPLYQRGHDRVGCYPCIFSNKEEIRLIAEHSPERIDLIERLEQQMVDVRRARNAAQPGRYAHPEDASFFQTQRQGFSGIRKVVEWAKTDFGGKQMQIFAPAPTGGCMKWGLCDLPSGDTTNTIPVAPPVVSQPEKRFWKVEFDCISFSMVARDREHVMELLRDYYRNTGEVGEFEEKLAIEVPDICELTEEQAALVTPFDDRRDGKRYPLTTFELGAVASSEY